MVVKGADNTDVNPETDLDVTDEVTKQGEVGSVFDWVNWPAGVWIDTDARGNDRIIDLPERSFATNIADMLTRDQTANEVFEALTLPILGADWSINTPPEDAGQAEMVRDNLLRTGVEGGMAVDFDMVMAQMTMACGNKRSYHEKVWGSDPDTGYTVYEQLAWRPPGACELIRDIKSGRITGFRQYMDFGLRQSRRDVELTRDGYVEIPANRALVYIHGQRRDPINGISSLSVTYQFFMLKQKILNLWLTFLGTQSLPRVLVYGKDPVQARQNAQNIAGLRTSGVVGVTRTEDPQAKMFDLLETSGKGAEQFQAMVGYCDAAMTHSVLAGFLDLTRQASPQGGGGARGSNALNQGSMDMFMQSRYAVAKEMAACFNTQVIAPLVRVNFGPDATIPQLVSGKISSDQTDRAIALLTALVTSPTLTVPPQFIGLLIEKAAGFLDMDPQAIAAIIDGHIEQVAKTQPGGVLPVANQVSSAVDVVNGLIAGKQGAAA